jgi:hypothetical protein
MAQSSVEILITARDDASRVLDGLGTNFQRQARGMETSASDVTRAVRLMAGGLLTELNPALGQSATQLAQVTSGASRFGGALGPLAIVLAVATAGLSQYVKNLREASEKQADLNIAVRTFDGGAIRSQLAGISKELEVLAVRGNTFIGNLQNKLVAAGEAMGIVTATSAQLAKAQEALSQVIPLERTEALTKILLEQLAVQRDIAEVEIAKADRLNDIERLTAAHSKLTTILETQANTERDLLELQSRITINRSIGIGEGPAAQEAIRATTAGRLTTQRNRDLARFSALGEQSYREEIAIRERLQPPLSPGLDEAERFEALAPGISPDPESRQRAYQATQGADQRALATRTQLLDIERQRLEITGSLSAQRAIELTMLETATKLSDERLTTDQKLLISAEGLLKIQQQLASVDATAGLVKGLNEVASEAEKVGDRTYEAMRSAASNMQRAWSDGFFSIITGDLKSLPDVAKQFGASMVRTLTDELGKFATGTIAGGLRSAIGGGTSFGFVGGGGSGGGLIQALFGGGGGVLSPTGAPAGSLVMTPGGLAQISPTGAVLLTQGGGGLSLGNIPTPPLSGVFSTSGSYLEALQATPLSSLFSYGSEAIATSQLGIQLGFYTTAGGSTIAAGSGAELALAGQVGGQLGAGSTGSTAAAAGGATAGAVAGGVLAGIALAFTIYSALQGPPTAQNIAMSAISGAVSGAVIGALVGSIFPGVGTVIGAVIGAVAGGAAGGGAAALGKPIKVPTTAERSEAIAQIAAGNLSGAISSASSIEDLVTIFNTQWAPHGEVQIITNYQGVFYWAGDADDPPGAAATPALMIIPEFLDGLIIQVGQGGAPRLRPDLVDMFRAKRDELLGILGQIPVGSYETDPLARVTRRSTFPFTQIYTMQPGAGQLTYSSDLLRRDLGADDNTVEFIIRRIREVSSKRGLDLSRKDFLFETT